MVHMFKVTQEAAQILIAAIIEILRATGGSRRDEYSNNGATNKSNSSYGVYDNDKDGISNPYDRKPESGNNGW